MVESSKLTQKLGNAEDRRKAFGEIHNRREGATSTEHASKNG